MSVPRRCRPFPDQGNDEYGVPGGGGEVIVMAGPLFAPIRGLIFALAFYPLRETLFGRKKGWLIVWWLLVALGILSTFGPAPGSVEGMLYTVIPITQQLSGWLEVIPQALLLSVILFYWVICFFIRFLGLK